MNFALLTLRDIAGIAFLIVILGGLFFVWLISVNSGFTTNGGFGPEWTCTYPGKGDPVCIKRPEKTENPK
jgi:hypothetical protein